LIRLLIISILFVAGLPAIAQHYFRGQVMDEKGKPLPYINIKVKTTGQFYKCDYDGSFGVPSRIPADSLYFSFDGYETKAVAATGKQLLKVSMKIIAVKKSKPRSELNSYILNVQKSFKFWTFNNETYTNLVENPFVSPGRFPVSTFSMNANRASYSNIRRFINDDEAVPPDAVRIEEMLNYFKLYYQQPSSDQTFKISSILTECPWRKENKLLFLNLSAKSINLDSVPANNLVFLIDVSGSMGVPKKLPLIKTGLRLLIKNLRDIDTISIVTYGGRVTSLVEGVSGNEKELLLKTIDSLETGGDTPGEAAIKTAYRIVRKRLSKGSNNRIVLATDGDFNVGSTSEKDLANLIESQRNAGIYLTCVGVGMGNYKDSKLSVLAQTGNGNFAYVDSEPEAEKVFFTEFSQTMYTVADGVYLTVDMDSSQVKEYRLIGYDNKRTDMRDTSIKIRGGEIGSGQTTTAIYEIKPGRFNGRPLARTKVFYRLPGEEELQAPVFHSCPDSMVGFQQLHPDLQKATCVTQFGLKLKLSEYISRKITWGKTLKFAEKYFNKANPADKEFLLLLEKSKKLYRKKFLGFF